ncbi:MAG: AI-2E family transporter, partial [Bacteroidota bacterium]
MLGERRTTNILLLLLVIPLVFYILKVLSFIFIPLIFSMFLALLFLPLMRRLGRLKVPKFLSILTVLILVGLTLYIGVELIQLSSRQILSSDSEFFVKAEERLGTIAAYLYDNFGFSIPKNESVLTNILKQENLGSTFQFLRKFLTTVLMTGFFMVLWLAESINVH